MRRPRRPSFTINALLGAFFVSRIAVAAEPIETPEDHVEAAVARVHGFFGDDRGGDQGTAPLPFAGDGWGLRLGYRHRPLHWLDLSVTPGLDVYAHAYRLAVPVQAHMRHALPGGHGITFGTGLGVERVAGRAYLDSGGTAHNVYRGAFLIVSLGGSIRVYRAWSVIVSGELTAGLGGADRVDPVPEFDAGGTDRPFVGGATASAVLGARRSF